MLTDQEIALARASMEFALQHGAQKVRVTLNKSLMELFGMLNGELDKVTHALDRSLQVALFVDGRFGSFSSNRLEEEGLKTFLLDAIDTEAAIAYGKACKRILMHKTDAYAIAEQAGFFLKELGGTGDGVIGAAAGIGLRLWGFDGTMKGKPKDLEPGKTYDLSELPKSRFIERVVTENGEPVPADGKLTLPNKTKVAVYEGILSLFVEPDPDQEGFWKPLDRERAKHFGDVKVFKEGCALRVSGFADLDEADWWIDLVRRNADMQAALIGIEVKPVAEVNLPLLK